MPLILPHFLARVALGLCLLLAVVPAAEPAGSGGDRGTPDRPNILVMTVSHQRFDTIGALGSAGARTPALDRLVAEGVAFTHATVSTPADRPSRWSLLTGQWTSTHGGYPGVQEVEPPGSHLVSWLREGGYRTVLVGEDHGFLTPEDVDLLVRDPLPTDAPGWDERQAFLDDSGDRHPLLVSEAIPGGAAADPERAKTDAALAAIRAGTAATDEPFFLWVAYSHPGPRYGVPDPWFAEYAHALLPPPLIEPGGLLAAGKPFRQRFHEANAEAILDLGDEDVRLMRRLYHAMVAQLDGEIGLLLDELDRAGVAGDTLVVYTSDHGDALGDHRLLGAAPALYDVLVRVPLILRWPAGFDGGHLDASPVSNVDLMPTLLEAAGLPVPDSVEGVSLLPYLRAAGLAFPRRAAFAEHGRPGEPYGEEALEWAEPGAFREPHAPGLPAALNPVTLAGPLRMIRTAAWKYVDEPGGRCELYDLRADPGELVNRCGDSELRERRTRLHERLDSWEAGRASRPARPPDPVSASRSPGRALLQ